jgi:hypothetical protein
MKPFKVATKVLCCKQDIPEVEAVKKLLFHPLKGALQAITFEVLERVNVKLDELETTVGAPDVDIVAGVHPDDRDDTLRELMASIIVSFASGESAFLPRGVENLIRDAAAGLLDMGADEIGVPRNYPHRPVIQAALVDELRVMILHLLTARRTDVEQAVSHFLTSSDPRTEKSEILLSGLPESELPRSKEEFDVLLAGLLLLSPTPEEDALVNRRIDVTLDIWAYGGFVAAEVEAGLAASTTRTRRTQFVAVALIDSGTTKFCRWVNGRTIPLKAIEKELKARRGAVARGDGAALIVGRKFLSPKAARSGSTSMFAKFFRTAGLPQYHIGCRTIVRIKPQK